MKKGIIAVICFMLSFSLVIPVFAEEKDYSYLEDMSVKELKELRAAIDKLLPPEEGVSATEQAIEFPEEDENGFKLNLEEDPYKIAAQVCSVVKSKCRNEDSFNLLEVCYAPVDEEDPRGHVYITYSAQNGFGGTNKSQAQGYVTIGDDGSETLLIFTTTEKVSNIEGFEIKDNYKLNEQYIMENIDNIILDVRTFVL